MLLWLILWLACGGTFLVMSYYIYSRQECHTITVAGGKIFEFTCYPAGTNPPGGAPSNLVALGLLVVGLLMIFFSVRHYIQNK